MGGGGGGVHSLNFKEIILSKEGSLGKWPAGALDLQSGGPGPTSCSGHSLDLFKVVPGSNPQLHVHL